MENRFLENDIGSLLPIVVLLLFLVIPYVLKTLGRYTAASRREDSHEEQGTLEGPPVYGDPPGHPVQQDHDRHEGSAPSNRPITPKWF